MHLLIIEDERDNQEVLTRLLQMANVSADSAMTAEEGLHFLANQEYDGVIIDLALPQMDGFGLLRTIRESAQLRHLKCVAITAFHSAEVKKQVIEVGFDGYFAKPISTRNFVNDVLEIFRS